MEASLVAIACNARSMGLIPRSERSLGEGNSNPLQYSCLGNPTDRGVWQATVHGVTQSQTQLKQLSMHSLELIPQDVAHKKDLRRLL